jgi:hypothetical protein
VWTTLLLPVEVVVVETVVAVAVLVGLEQARLFLFFQDKLCQ